MDKSASFADKDSDREPEEMDSLLDQLLDAPSPPSESPKQETVPTTGNSTASTRSAFSMFWLVLQLFTEYLYIPQLRIMISNVFKRLKGKENESTENKINLLLANDKSFRMKYKVDLRLGSGAYGIVYKVTPKLCDKELKGTLALKILCEDSMRDPQTTLNETKNNIRLCQNSSCPNVVSFFSFNEYTYQSYRYLCLEMELCDGGTLKKSEFHEPKYVTDTFRKKILEEAISGMIFIHDCGVAHWDIHGDNIFFKSPMDETVKFGDFGLTRESPSTQHLDVQALGRTLLKWVFLRESNLSGEESKISIEFLLCKIKVQKDIREILEGLTFNTMSLSEAKRKMIEIQEKDSSDGKEELVSINCASDKGSSTSNNITANSAVRKMRTVEEMLKIDPFYPKKCNGEFLQPQDLVHFIIVYPKCNYTEVEKFTSWFKCLIEKDASITFEMRLYDDEEFPSDRVPLAKEIYERAMYVLFYLTKDFHEEMYPSFVSSEGIGQTKFQQSTQIPERHVYSRLAQKQKIDCRRPIHTMPIETRNYETPSGLTTIKSIDYFDTNKNKGYLEKTLRNLGRSANMKLEERKKAMLKCLFEESDDVHNEKNDAGSSASVTQSYLQVC
ncbi:uncharacterized protein LOC133199151 [Saccostrea echinata]|uniref:uncharacterized protein LOC133199151 n=1 Tax=Saccostrea echinata TaxID=191078 RepID=UPI002A810FF0|nr:uncharacterized protein LOC133199151 [Saccostrea echinata]